MAFMFGRLWMLGTILALFGASPAAQAQSVERIAGFDPAAIIYAPRSERIDPCGVRMGVDPLWTREVSRSRDASGDAQFSMSFGLGRSTSNRSPYWQRHGNRAHGVSVTPTLTVTLNCDEINADTTTRFFGPAMMDGFERVAGRFVQPPQVIQWPGIGDAYLGIAQSRDGLTRWMMLAASRDGLTRVLSVRIASHGSNIRATSRLRAGDIARFEGDGGVLEVELAVPANRNANGTLFRTRTLQEDVAFFNAILGQLR